MLNIALFGAPGAGKGTQSDLLMKKHNLVYIATGDILRQEIADGTELGLEAKAIIEQGGLVSDEIIVQIIEKKITTNPDAAGFLFDGFPRTFVQAYILEGLLLKMHTRLACLISLEVSPEVSFERLMNRAKTSGRSDDTEEVIRNRLEEYEKKTAPVAQFYREQDLYFPVDGEGTIEEINTAIEQVIEKELRKTLFNVVLLGYPGAGRGTQARHLAQKYNLVYLSTGDMLKEEIAGGTSVGREVQEIFDRGDLVPDEIVIRLIEKHIQENPEANGFIFKGFPRTLVLGLHPGRAAAQGPFVSQLRAGYPLPHPGTDQAAGCPRQDRQAHEVRHGNRHHRAPSGDARKGVPAGGGLLQAGGGHRWRGHAGRSVGPHRRTGGRGLAQGALAGQAWPSL